MSNWQKVKVPVACGRQGNGVLEPSPIVSWAQYVTGGAQSAPYRPLTFPEVNQVPIRCWVDSECFPVFWPKLE